jgi:hypothetical protein
MSSGTTTASASASASSQNLSDPTLAGLRTQDGLKYADVSSYSATRDFQFTLVTIRRLASI